jgi:tetratricopeptide (TPR) repeat protein
MISYTQFATIIGLLFLLTIVALAIFSGSGFVLQKQQQQAMAQNYAFSQIQNNMTDKASVENVETLLNKGIGLQSLGKYQEAIGYYDRALAVEPNNLIALNKKGQALVGLGRYQEAISSFDKALSIEPNYVDALFRKGAVLSVLEKYQEAISYYDKALSIQPNNTEFLKLNKWFLLSRI